MIGSALTGIGSVLTAGESDGGGGGAAVNASLIYGAVLASPTTTGARTLTGAQVGDVVKMAIDMTGVIDARTCFEATITVAGQIQQTATFPGGNLLVPVLLVRPS
ncbi:MAG TPA: hypothetical protein VEB22_11275 [Phycisphaerales bacterium]|nr:hypothetical protein [Phycisphaerales bacterium]